MKTIRECLWWLFFYCKTGSVSSTCQNLFAVCSASNFYRKRAAHYPLSLFTFLLSYYISELLITYLIYIYTFGLGVGTHTCALLPTGTSSPNPFLYMNKNHLSFSNSPIEYIAFFRRVVKWFYRNFTKISQIPTSCHVHPGKMKHLYEKKQKPGERTWRMG